MNRSIKQPRGSVLRFNRTQLATLNKFRKELQKEQQSEDHANTASNTNRRDRGLSNTSNQVNTQQPEHTAPAHDIQSRSRNTWKSSNRNTSTVDQESDIKMIDKPTNTRNTRTKPRSRHNAASSEHSSISGNSRDASLTRNNTRDRTGRRDRSQRRTDSNNNDKENNNNNNTNHITSNARTARRGDASRSKSRTRNNAYKKPMTLNEAKEKCKALRQQLNEVNEAHDRLLGEKEDLEDELSDIQQRHQFDVEQKEVKINQLQRDKMKFENENNLNLQKIQNLQTQIEYKDSQIQMAQSAKNAADQQLMTLQQTIKMKESMLMTKEQELNMIKSQQKMLSDQCQSQQQQIQELNANLQQLRAKNNSNENKLKQLESENMTLSLKNTSLSNTNQAQFNKIQELSELTERQQQQISFNNQRMQSMKHEFNTLSQQKEMLENECQSQSNTIHQQDQQIKQLQQQCTVYEEKARKDEEVRKRLHNTILELKGNIRVFCRVRPILDQSNQNERVYEFEDDDIEHQSITLLTPSSYNSFSGQYADGKKYNFEFDRVFRPFAKQDLIFDEISQLVQSALDGYKVCIFAYGQTGSGKTFTMEGPSLHRNDVNRGMIPRSVEKIFEHQRKLKEKGWNYQCKATYLEIYNEHIRDLLVRRSSNSGNDENIEYLEIHQKKVESNNNNNGSNGGKSTTAKTEVYVEGLTEVEVRSALDVYPLLSLASKNRSVGKTDCNARSSRSHSVFQLFLTGSNEITGQNRFGVLNLIDLAGSERLKKSNATGLQLKETQNINKSLSCLGDVIAALSSKKNRSHIPYRNSKLTYLLMNYFGGDAKTLMFVNLCPEKDKYDESLCSLRFAAKVNDCQIGIAKRNVSQ
eukprot:CAMPEP_0197021846 /NCGR_PEP_ID=MMETSP1384-20130603/2733_1 /TAXON_ID=29189 /ORGANISM="Ammonia sp." /LENGTH=864 /DNA_ID=CAMNT_0042449759 /DNA_START=40 /DNA_END=2634 /DNA_ORIENTATION=-